MGSGSPDYFPRIITTAKNEDQQKASVTASQTTITFSQKVLSWILYNDGAYPVHYSLSTGVATTNFKIPPGAGLMMDIPTKYIYLICATGETATVYAVGVY